jgi:serine/threonine-protein kinase SRPK3
MNKLTKSVTTDDLSLSSDERDCKTNGDIFNGEVLNGRYLLIKKIGYGSFSSVWLSFDCIDKKYYAIKIQNSDDYKEGKEEISFMKKLNTYKSKYINNLLSYFIERKGKKKYICMVFNLLAGSLYDVIRKGKYSEGLPIKTVKSIVKQTLLGLDILHNKLNYIHSDLKPENVMLCGRTYEISDIIEDYDKYRNQISIKKEIIKYCKNKNIIPNKGKIDKKHMYIILKNINNIILEQVYNEEITSNTTSENELTSDETITTVSSSSEIISEDYTYDEDVIDDKYILECNIKLGDFGNVCNLTLEEEEELEYGIQTRYYRAPEVLIIYPYNSTCDIWSLGCMIYELLTGDILFDPKKDKEYDRDMYHLVMMNEFIGDMPKKMIKKCQKKKFFNDYKLNYKKPIKSKKILDYLSDIIDDKRELKNVIDFLSKTLVYDPDCRMTVRECLKHKWLN